MSFTTSTPYMNLTLPEPTLEPGPQWAVELNEAFTLVDSHNHSPGYGAPIVAASLDINSDLPFNNQNATLLRSARFSNQGSPLSLPSDIGALYVSGGDFWYNNLAGQQVKITAGGSLNAGAIGGIGGDYATAGALVSYIDATKSYLFTTDGTNYANMLSGAIKIYGSETSNFGVTLQAPSSLSASYILTLPTGLPAVQTALSVTSTGQIRAGIVGGTAADVSPGYGLVPSASIIAFGGIAAPSGYLMCDGTSYLIASYPVLAAALFDSGTGLYAYGAADGTHFNVPDLRGMFVRGTDNTAGRDPDSFSRTANNANGNTGDNVGSEEAFATQLHSHGVTAQYIQNAGAGTFSSVMSTNPAFLNGVAPSQATSINSGSTSLETRPINVNANYIIKT